jgi:CheY-like chemotaxis protein
VAKILVADDNSNVQKTVALALADLGVEIVSVNNGEAAVRKLPEVSPDLILADIFMPVRNGYEVCEYVKKDSRFSRVPVVLLVGAFDPLDEREAQRVGADGILKKPFVPTDPLITMVKTLLDRTLGERLVAATVSRPPVANQAKGGGNTIAEAHSPAPETSEESSSQEFPRPVERVAFGEGEHPVAFGQLLETPARDNAAPNTGVIEPVDDEQILTSSRPATLGDPIFWRNDSPEAEREAEEPEDISISPEVNTWKQGEDSLPRRDEAVLLQPIEPLELVRDEQDEASPSVVDLQSVLLDPAAQAPLTVDSGKAGDLAANPTEWMATATPERSSETSEPPPEWDDPIPDATGTIDKVESSDHPLDLAPVSVQASTQVSTSVLVPVLTQPDAVIPDKTSAIPTSVPATPVLPAFAEPAPLLPKLEAAPSSSSQSTTDTARSIPRQDWADLTRPLDSNASDPAIHQNKSGTAPAAQLPVVATGSSQRALTGPVQTSSPDPALVEAVVQRVLEKMCPQVVDIITKEFLRPIVQALVHREIEKQ